jgi:DNA replication licensing factor MCM3
MLGNRTLTEEQTLIRRQFIDFFESDRFEAKYQQRIARMMSEGNARLIMDMNDLLDFSPPVTAAEVAGQRPPPSLGHGLMHHPGKYVPLAELAIHDLVLRQQPEYLKVDYRSRAVHVGFEGPVGRVLGPRELYARHLNTLVALEGVVTRQSALRPRVIQTVHFCPETNKFSQKEYRDQLTPLLDSTHLPTVNIMPKTDMEGHALRTELGLSVFVDSQCAMLQEAPENAPTGQLPRSVELRFDDDLVDSVKPGDRVTLVGLYMPYTTADSKSFQCIVLVNHVLSHSLSRLARPLDTQVDDLKKFCAKCVAEHGAAGPLTVLSRSVAPGIFGLANEKRAILLQLVGGVERKAHNSHIRGDINVLLVGEPSTAKSQLLRCVLGLSPLALSTTGKGSSGVGLTAAVTVDSYSGERSLSAGAMVLADRGILCVDEFDKMSPQDRVAMHEAMEQQTVTIAKAGIHASLNARCSVLAAANPVYGFYSVRHKLAFNVGLPESLLSRFDLVFIILDQHSSDFNRRIGGHILHNHMMSAPAPFETIVSKTVVEKEQQRGPLEAAVSTNAAGEAVVGTEFLKKYIAFVKTMSPMLTEHSQRLVSQHYVQLRAEQEQAKDGFFVTARTLEAIVRLSTANAKLRMSLTVDECDVNAAMELLRASVHAASDASAQRQRDREDVANEAGAGDQRRKATRTEQGGPSQAGAAGASSAAPVVPDRLNKSVMAALKTFQQQKRPSVYLHEVRDLVGQDVNVLELQRSLTQLQGESFVYDSTDVEDIIHFV